LEKRKKIKKMRLKKILGKEDLRTSSRLSYFVGKL